MDPMYKPPVPTAPPPPPRIYDYPSTNNTLAIGIPIIHEQVQPQAYNNQTTTAGVSGAWSTGLCDCFSDVSNCCITCWCPCITFGYIAEIVDRGSTSCVVSGALYGLIAYLTGCSCIYSFLYRSKMRSQYMLAEEPCPDCIIHFCCESCALCQEYRELQHRGFDMSIGWQGNVERQNQGGGVIMGPIGSRMDEQRMIRS